MTKVLIFACILASVLCIAFAQTYARRHPELYLLSLLPHTALVVQILETDLLSTLILTTFWSFYLNICILPLYFVIGPWILLHVYLPLFLMMASKRAFAYIAAKRQKHGSEHAGAYIVELLFLSLQSIIWDWPLLIWMRICNLVGKRALGPFITILDDDIAIGSLPLNASDVETLKSVPYNVGFIVNMCRETVGPLNHYQKHNILHVHTPVPDLSEPTLKEVIDTIALMKTYLRSSKRGGNVSDNSETKGSSRAPASSLPLLKSRIFVHCKAGRGRSACMVLCYYIVQQAEQKMLAQLKEPHNSSLHALNQGSTYQAISINIDEAFQKVKSKRPIGKYFALKTE